MSVVAEIAKPKATFSRMSSVFLVDRIEPCLEFWVDRLGFEVRLKVEEDDRLEFVQIGRDGVELMFRTRDSVNAESPGLFEEGEHAPWVVIHLEVDDLDEVLPALDGVELVVPPRQTIFGTGEVFVREPSGRIVAITSRAA